jgi:hypothetical protein
LTSDYTEFTREPITSDISTFPNELFIDKQESFNFSVKLVANIDISNISLVFEVSSPQRISISSSREGNTFQVTWTDLGLELSNEYGPTVVDMSVEGTNSDCVSSTYTTIVYSGCKPDKSLSIDFASQTLCPDQAVPCLFFREGMFLSSSLLTSVFSPQVFIKDSITGGQKLFNGSLDLKLIGENNGVWEQFRLLEHETASIMDLVSNKCLYLSWNLVHIYTSVRWKRAKKHIR